MKSVAVIVLVTLVLYPSDEHHFKRETLFIDKYSADVFVKVDLSRALHRVDPRFLSVTIDASLASEERFMILLG